MDYTQSFDTSYLGQGDEDRNLSREQLLAKYKTIDQIRANMLEGLRGS